MTSAKITLIAALARNGVIGQNNQIPWKIPGELAYFKRVTMGHAILMGRKTWESIGRPLPGRRNIIITRNRNYAAPGTEVAATLGDALEMVSEPEAFVIGGAQIYAEAFPRAHRLLLTEIDAEFDGDTFFPAFDRNKWRETRREQHPPTDERAFGYSFVTYER